MACVQLCSVGKYGILFSGSLLSSSSRCLMNSGHSLLQLEWSLEWQLAHLLVRYEWQSDVRCVPLQVPQVSSISLQATA